MLKPYKSYKKKNISGNIFNSDAIDFLKSIKTNSTEIVFLDPPFNLGKKYDNNSMAIDNYSEDNYRDWMYTIFDESIRVLTEGGALYLYHLPFWAMRFGTYISQKLDFVHWIAISMKNGFIRTNKLYPAHYSLLFFTKGKPNNLNRPKISPKVCKNCGEYIKDYGGYKSIIEEKGINLSDFWEDLSPVRHSNDKLREQNQLPLLLTYRIVEISGITNKLFVDPFAGTGTSIISAIKKGMVFMGNDIVKENCDIIIERIDTNFLK